MISVMVGKNPVTRGKSNLKFDLTSAKIWLDNDNTVHIKATGDMTNAAAEELLAIQAVIFARAEGVLNVLVDLNEAGKSSPYARKVCKKMCEHERNGKIALFGLHPVARALASFFVGRTGRNNMGFFRTEQEARDWFTK